jgi:hypothetical protein
MRVYRFFSKLAMGTAEISVSRVLINKSTFNIYNDIFIIHSVQLELKRATPLQQLMALDITN